MSHNDACLGVQTRKLIKGGAGGEHGLERLEGRKPEAERMEGHF